MPLPHSEPIETGWLRVTGQLCQNTKVNIMTNIETNASTHYTAMFKNWQLKLLGPKPSTEQLAAVHGLGARPGKQALAIAMATRECGVTGSQIVIACGAPQLNKMRGLVADALLRELPAPLAENGHKVYHLEVTPKGRQRIERSFKAEAAKVAAGAAEAEKAPAKKAKGKKARKAKVAPATVPSNGLDTAEIEPPQLPEGGAIAQLPAPQL
jgi:hypothetical protein